MKVASSTDGTSKRDKFPSRQPIDISKTAWFYEDHSHIKMIVELRNKDGGYLATTHTRVPYKLLCRTVDRYRKAKAKRRNK